jgi:hypothetical protein
MLVRYQHAVLDDPNEILNYVVTLDATPLKYIVYMILR